MCNFSKTLKDYRELFGLSLRDLAILSGVSYQHISRIEQNKSNVTLVSADKLANGLGVELWQMLKTDDPITDTAIQCQINLKLRKLIKKKEKE